MDAPSLDYYRAIFHKNPQNMPTIKKLIWNDFKAMQLKLSDAVNRDDRHEMRKELHKIRPIAHNLRYARMIELLDRYESTDASTWETKTIHDEVSACVAEIDRFLNDE
jgi:hypothetical protein